MRGDAYRAQVTRATGDGVWVTIPQRWPGQQFGPLPTCEPSLTEDTRVLVVDTGDEDFVVVGILQWGVA